MGLFAKKPARKNQNGAESTLMLPLTSHEAGQLASLFAAIRSGDRNAAGRYFADMEKWPTERTVVALLTVAKRYLQKVMGDMERVGARVEADSLVEEIHGSLPGGASRDLVFKATVLTLAEGGVAADLVEHDPGEAIVALAYLCAGCTNVLRKLGVEPAVASMLHGVVAPW